MGLGHDLQAGSLKKGIKKEKGRRNTFLSCAPCASWYCVWERWGELACPSVPEWGLLICSLHGVTWSWGMLRYHRSPGFGCWEQLPLWMLVLGCQWVWFVMTMFAETTMTVGFPMFLDRCSHKPDTSMRITLCTGFGSAAEGLAAQNGPPLLSFLSKALCFTFSYAQQNQLRQICHCCSLHNDLQNRSELEQLLHKLGLNAQMKTRKQTNKTLHMIVALHASLGDGLEEGCLLFLSSERHAGCQLLSLLSEQQNPGEARSAIRWVGELPIAVMSGKVHPTRAEFGIIITNSWNFFSACIWQDVKRLSCIHA